MQDRMNEEIKRRTRVVRTFPDQESCLRLARAPAAETHEGWLEEHCYLNRGCVRPTCAHPRPHWPVRSPSQNVPLAKGGSSMAVRTRFFVGGVGTHGRNHHAATIETPVA